MFVNKAVFMMAEAKRLLNGDVLCSGLWFAASSSAAEPEPLQDFGVITANDSEEDGEKAENNSENIDTSQLFDGGAPEPADKSAKEPPAKKQRLQQFTAGTSVRDDWLHRGDALQDVDFYHYIEYIERQKKPLQNESKQGMCIYFFDQHYPMAKSFVQTLRRKHVLPRIVGHMCPKADVNGGEDNAAFKSMLFAPLRCPGPGRCADPLQCRPTLFQNSSGKHAFAPAWRARRAEIELLADDAEAKKQRAKRILVIHDCTLVKQHKFRKVWLHSIRHDLDLPLPDREVVAHVRHVQVAMTKLIRLAVRRMPLGVCARHERAVEHILSWAGLPILRHEEQPYTSEFTAHTIRERLFNLDLSIEAHNRAKAKEAKSKAIPLLLEEQAPLDGSADAPSFHQDDTGFVADEENCDQSKPDGITAVKIQDLKHLASIITRQAEVKAAMQGKRTRDQFQDMRTVADVFSDDLNSFLDAFDTRRVQNEKLGHDVDVALAYQKQEAERLRAAENEDADAPELREEDTPLPIIVGDRNPSCERIEITEDMRERGPAYVAKKLCDAAHLNKDQKRPVALVAAAMQKEWNRNKPLRKDKKIVRMLLVGGGGCGKSRIIKLVFEPLFKTFFGPRGCLLTAGSNRAARALGGKTIHMAIKYGAGGLSMHKLRVTDKQRRGLTREFVPKGALVNDEWSQDASMLYHGYALRATYARAPYYNLDPSRYAEKDQSFGAMAIMIDSGDELQLPPVPETASLLAPVEGRSDEHVAGVRIFKDRDYVCRLTTAMRFTDEVLVRILQKMRTVGGAVLSPEEWQKLLDTELVSMTKGGGKATLKGTELWYQAAYGWNVIAMAQVVRSRLSAKAAHATLYAVQAEDSIMNMPPGDMSIEDATQLILRHPNMNDTGRLAAVALLHIGMRVRLTVTIEGAAVDSTGTIVGIDLHPTDASAPEPRAAEGVRLLQEMPQSVLVKLDDSDAELLPPRPCSAHQDSSADRSCPNCRFYSGHIAVEPRRCRAPAASGKVLVHHLPRPSLSHSKNKRMIIVQIKRKPKKF